MKLSLFLAVVLIVAGFVLGLVFYPQMPSQMASHWNFSGEANGYMSKFWGLFLMPIITAGILILFLVIPLIDPLRQNIATFRKYFDWFILAIIAFLFYINLLSILWILNITFSMTQMITPAIGLLFFFAGLMIENTKRNWFIGIRTPWTLSSDTVWEKTHRLGGKLFKASGVIAIIGIFFPSQALWFVIAPIIATTVLVLVYSYVEYRKETRQD